MADEPVIAAGGAGEGGGAADAGGGPDLSTVSEGEALESVALDGKLPEGAETTEETTTEQPADVPASETDINLAALDAGRPEWLAKVTDPAAKGEIEKILDKNAQFDSAFKFKDDADREQFFKDLPGGREQVTALQTLSKEVGELDGALEANTPEGLAMIAERYLAMTPDGGARLLRAQANHIAKNSPEAWNQLSTELVNSTLTAAGIGTDLGGMIGAIEEMRAAVAADDGAAFGTAAQKLLGQPKGGKQTDPKLQSLTERENRAREAEQRASLQVWETNAASTVGQLRSGIDTTIKTALDVKDSQGRPLIPASIPAKDRESLVSRISAEVDQQLGADAWLMSQIANLIGSPKDSKHNLQAEKQHFEKAAEITKAAAQRLIGAAVKKHVTAWSTELVKANQEAIAKAKGTNGNGSTSVGGTTPQAKGPRRLSQNDIVGDKALSDKEALELALGLN